MIDISRYRLIEKQLGPVSVAIQLIDNITKANNPVGDIKISLRKVDCKSVKSISSYHSFFGLESGEYTVLIKSDYYQEKEFPVTLPWNGSPPVIPGTDQDDIVFTEVQNVPLAQVHLMPEINYPFDTGATLIRGAVYAANNPIPNALIHVEDADASPSNLELLFRTNTKGQFVLCCNKLLREKIDEKIYKYNIVEINGKEYNEGGKIRISCIDPVLGSAEEIVEINSTTEGKSKFVTLSLV